MTPDLTRRAFIETSGVLGGVAAMAPALGVEATAASPAPRSADQPIDAPDIAVTLTVNGQARAVDVDPRTTLLDALRERLGLTGAKKGCDIGACGACTVLIDGRRVNACLTLAVMAQGRAITTIEGLGSADQLHVVQQAFIEHDAFQCGYCTPGQILSAVALIGEGWTRSDAEVRELMSGNICRCGAYPNIVAAIKDAAGKA
jgi:xanthine dehydrogenase YagT iron-sulfur-binding subunit